MNGKKRLALKSKREADIVSALKIYDSQLHPVGNSLPYSTKVYRVKVVTATLKAGVPLSKIASFRELLEEHVFNSGVPSKSCNCDAKSWCSTEQD